MSKTVLITGATSGIGKATAKHLAEKGYRVIGASRNPDKASDLTDEAESKGWDLTLAAIDVRDDGSVKSALDQIGQVDVLVNNAGFEVWGPLEEMTVDDLKDQFETNVYGPFRLMLAVVPSMRERGEGVIVNVSSVAGVVAAPLGGAYAASKWALEALTEALHYEAGHFGIRTHLIEPGVVETGFAERRKLIGAGGGDESSPYRELVVQWEGQVSEKLNPGGSSTTAEDVASAIGEAIEKGEQLRYPVGNDANMVLMARKSMTFEQFEAAMRQQLELNW